MNRRIPKIIAYLFPTFANLLWMVAFFYVLINGRSLLNADGDLALHLSMGRYILDYRQIPLRDVFSHTLAGQPAAQHKWLSQVVFALFERMFGLAGVVLLCALVIAAAFWLVFKRARNGRQGLIMAVMVAFLAMVTSMVHWLIRPHVFTFLLLAAWMLVLDKLRKGEVQCWWHLPALMVLWVNLHGGFVAGFVTWLIYGLGLGWDAFWGERTRMNNALLAQFWSAYLLGGVSALGASLLNPSGIGLWKLIVNHLGNKYLADITLEFQSPNFHETGTWPFLLMIGLLFLLLGLNSKQIAAYQLFTGVAWLGMGLYSGRNIPLFAIVTAPLLVQSLDDHFSSAAYRFTFIDRLKQIDNRITGVDRQLIGLVWPALIILIVVIGLGMGLSFDSQGRAYEFDPEVFPVEAVNWLMENPQEGEMFNYFTWGGYLQYRLWPEKRVFIDSNSDFYGEGFVRQYMQVIQQQQGWEGVLHQYDVAWAILPANNNAARGIMHTLDWDPIYQDGTAVILRRKGSH